MYLKQLTLSGFKSFARKTSLEFTQGITAVVGPNGSGKSNIADAIRWVMGEQSVKTLRAKKGEDVIFSGSDKKTRLGLAEVSLYLDNSEKKIPIDYSELVLTRRIYRSGESDYLINGSKSRLTDINLLLTKAQFGHRTYSVIGQGMIDNFLIATPQERKEFFEEATGVKQYQIKKNQSLQKLEGVWQNLNTLKIKTSEMEPRLRLLTRQVKKLNKRKEIESDLNQTKLTYYSSYWQEIDKKYQDQKSSIDQLNSSKGSLSSDWKRLEDKLNKITKDSGLNKELGKLRTFKEQLMDKKMALKEDLLTLKLSINKQVVSTQEKIKSISSEDLTLINSKLEEVNLLHQKLIDELDREKNPDLIKEQILNINKKVSSLLSSLKPYIKSPQETKSVPQDSKKDNDIKKLEDSISHFNQQINDIQSQIKELEEEDRVNRSKLWQIQQDYQTSQQKLNDINNQINEARINLARTETKRFDLRQEINHELHGLENLKSDSLPDLSDQEKMETSDKINRLKSQLEVIGGLDPEIEAEYETTKERYEFLIKQIDDLNDTSKSLKKLINELDDIIKAQVNKSFSDINNYFQKYFKVLFNGGRANLTLIKSEENKEVEIEEDEMQDKKTAVNFFQEKNKAAGFTGIEVQATPPGKKLKSINALSGGERSLVSIALICAIISSNPSPFVVLDEVDAALDESNSIRFAEILDSLSHKTQFIVITHNRASIEKGNRLYGVTMGDDGVSKLLSINLEEAKKYEK